MNAEEKPCVPCDVAFLEERVDRLEKVVKAMAVVLGASPNSSEVDTVRRRSLDILDAAYPDTPCEHGEEAGP